MKESPVEEERKPQGRIPALFVFLHFKGGITARSLDWVVQGFRSTCLYCPQAPDMIEFSGSFVSKKKQPAKRTQDSRRAVNKKLNLERPESPLAEQRYLY